MNRKNQIIIIVAIPPIIESYIGRLKKFFPNNKTATILPTPPKIYFQKGHFIVDCFNIDINIIEIANCTQS